MSDYSQNSKSTDLDALTTLDSGDLIIVGDLSDSGKAKKITKANTLTDFGSATQTLTNKTIDSDDNTVSIKEDSLSITDNTTGDVSSSAHGFAPKGDGSTTKFLSADGTYRTPSVIATSQAYTPSAAGTATLDLSLGNDHRITMPAGNITIALTGVVTSQKFMISITQDSVGSRTVTWFNTIRWAGGSVPSLTATANKRDVFVFIQTGVATYDGFVLPQNI